MVRMKYNVNIVVVSCVKVGNWVIDNKLIVEVVVIIGSIG